MEPILFWSDTQLDVGCLRQFRQTVDDVIAHAQAHGVRHLIHAGDVKDALNPIDGRVLDALMEAAGKFRGAGLKTYVNLGNHDMLGTTPGSGSWASTLRAAGFQVFETYTAVEIGGWAVDFYPFTFDPEGMKRQLLASASGYSAKRLLVFHQGLMGAKLSELRRADHEALSPADFQPDAYRWIVGGHYHAQHEVVDKVWYCGSPFCTRWDEANQTKGFLLVDVMGDLVRLPSSIPGWYDPTWPNFPEQLPKGARVRVSVPLEKGVEPGAIIARKVADAQRNWQDAEIVPAPTVIGRESVIADIRADSTDVELVHAYVDATFSSESVDTQYQVRDYLENVIAAVGGARRADLDITLLELEAENILSFEKLKINYQAPAGLRVIYGVNEDRPGKSNGAGKTAYLQVLMAIWFGETLKGQKHDRLRRRGAPRNAPSYGRLTMRTGQGRHIVLERSRTDPKPYVKLWVDGVDESVGKGDAQITRMMEELTGFTEAVATASLFVDQRRINQLLAGRPAERKAVLSSFLNLERFAKGMALVKDAGEKHARFINAEEAGRAKEQGLLESYEATLVTLQARRADDAAALDTEAKALEAEGHELAKKRKSLDNKYEARLPHFRQLEANAAEAEKAYQNARSTSSAKGARLAVAEGQLQQAKAPQADTCYACGAPLRKKDLSTVIAQLETDILSLRQEFQRLVKAEEGPKKTHQMALNALSVAQVELQTLRTQAAALDGTLREKRARYMELKRRADDMRVTEHSNEAEYKAKAKAAWRWLRNFPAYRAELDQQAKVLAMCQRALTRDGIPAMVASLLCPRLNASAAYYAHLIGDGAVSIAFAMDEDELSVSVINPMGGEELGDQSNGETQAAALLTTLTLRDNVKSNVLFLDEMSLGFDAVSAKELARGISQLRERFPVIFITSHDPYVLNGLEDYSTVEIRKKNGISYVHQDSNSTGVCAVDRGAPEAQSHVRAAGQSGSGGDAGNGTSGGTPEGKRTRRRKAGTV